MNIRMYNHNIDPKKSYPSILTMCISNREVLVWFFQSFSYPVSSGASLGI
jgi:hypothetical protein